MVEIIILVIMIFSLIFGIVRTYLNLRITLGSERYWKRREETINLLRDIKYKLERLDESRIQMDDIIDELVVIENLLKKK